MDLFEVICKFMEDKSAWIGKADFLRRQLRKQCQEQLAEADSATRLLILADIRWLTSTSSLSINLGRLERRLLEKGIYMRKINQKSSPIFLGWGLWRTGFGEVTNEKLDNIERKQMDDDVRYSCWTLPAVEEV